MVSYREKLWRALLRVEKIDYENVHFIIPAWNSHTSVPVKKEKIPNDIIPTLHINKRLHAKVNIGCDSTACLHFTDWEIN